MVSFGAQRQLVPTIALSAASLIIAVDYDMCIPAQTARSSSLFLTDDVAQLLAQRARVRSLPATPTPTARLARRCSVADHRADIAVRSSWTISAWALRMSSLPTRSSETPPRSGIGTE